MMPLLYIRQEQNSFCWKECRKKYADIAGAATQGFAQYVKEVKEGTFPAPEHKYKISGDVSEFDRLFKEMEEEIRL